MQTVLPAKENFIGLSQAEAVALGKQFGKNSFKSSSRGGVLHILWEVIREPMFLLLIFACLLYFILKEPREGMLMLVAMLFVAAISVYQELKSSKALAALQKFTEPKIIVIRDGMEQEILSEDIVPGDIILIEEGNLVPADGILLQANDLTINESTITGESIPADKNETEGSNLVFQGTTINTGKGYAKVTQTGNNTQLGRLGKAIEAIVTTPTLLQRQINRFVKAMAIVGISSFLLIWLVNYLHTGNIAQSLLLGLTLAMSAIPEEIPVAFSSFMALGAFRMSKLGIIARHPQTIESLGTVSIICLDKTGTLTENRMEVKSLYDSRTGKEEEWKEGIPFQQKNVLWFARLASETEPFDAMEKAIVQAFDAGPDVGSFHDLQMVHEYPLTGRPPMMTHVYQGQGRTIIAAKGAPEKILEVCKTGGEQARLIRQKVTGMAAKGYRVLGVCSVSGFEGIYPQPYPESQDNFEWQLEGLIALYDPPKKNISQVFADWKNAGIRVKIISGDFAETILNIAAGTGMPGQQKYLTGEQVMDLSAGQLAKTVEDVNIFARMFPEAKLKVVDALKANGEIVAMTGDGVNDGPALQSANIGIAMGDKGTEIAKEAADLVISDDNLGRITEAIRQGRTINENLKKATRYLIGIHLPILITASFPLLLGWKFPTVFSPIHVIFLELIMGPTCSIFYEREPVEDSIMKMPPRTLKQGLFRGPELPVTILQGLVTAGSLLCLYYFFMNRGYSLEYTRTMVFMTLIISNIFLTLAIRSFRETIFTTIRYKNSLVPFVLAFSLLFLVVLYCVPFARNLFQLTRISAFHALIAAGTALVAVGWFEVYKGVKRLSFFRRPGAGL